MLGQRRRRWSNIEPALVQRPAGMSHNRLAVACGTFLSEMMMTIMTGSRLNVPIDPIVAVAARRFAVC